MKLFSQLAIAVLLATATFAPVMAQSSVNVSGYLNAGISKTTGGATTLGSLGRSNLAFSGNEELGGGLSAVFRLSTRFEIDSGTFEVAPVGSRPFLQDESTVGLKGDFGTVRLGRALSPLVGNNWAFDPWSNFDRIGSPLWWFGAPDFLVDPGNVTVPKGTDLDYLRLSNAVFYDSPIFGGGFQVHLDAAVEKKTGIDRARGTGAAINYRNGPLALMFDLEQNSQKDTVAFLGAAYTIGNLGLTGTYSRVKLDPNGTVYRSGWTNWAGASDPTTKRTSMTLGTTYSMGQSTLRAGFGRDFQGSTNFFNYIGSTFFKTGTGYSGASNFYSLGYSYALSKRTNLFADLTRVTWKFTDDNGRTSATGYALGMTHAF